MGYSPDDGLAPKSAPLFVDEIVIDDKLFANGIQVLKNAPPFSLALSLALSLPALS